jgi:hypothetical protein
MIADRGNAMVIKELTSHKYWIALGMIQPEWIYMSHFLSEEEVEKEEAKELGKEIETPKINFRPRLDR